MTHGLTLREFARHVLVTQWPILVVAATFVAAVALVAAGYWRRGAVVIGSAVAVATVLRAVLSEDRAGLLAVRSRGTDLLTTASVAVAVFYIAWTIDPLGTG